MESGRLRQGTDPLRFFNAHWLQAIDETLGWPNLGEHLDIISVEFGHRTNWHLTIEMAAQDSPSRWIAFHRPISFRVQDEGDLLGYWQARDFEHVGIGNIYSIRESHYLDEMRTGLSGLAGPPMTHFLVGGMNICVEVLGTSPPEARFPTAQR